MLSLIITKKWIFFQRIHWNKHCVANPNSWVIIQINSSPTFFLLYLLVIKIILVVSTKISPGSCYFPDALAHLPSRKRGYLRMLRSIQQPSLPEHFFFLRLSSPSHVVLLSNLSHTHDWAAHTHDGAAHTHDWTAYTHDWTAYTHDWNAHTLDWTAHTHDWTAYTHDWAAHTHDWTAYTHDWTAYTHDWAAHTHDWTAHTHDWTAYTHDWTAYTHNWTAYTHNWTAYTHNWTAYTHDWTGVCPCLLTL